MNEQRKSSFIEALNTIASGRGKSSPIFVRFKVKRRNLLAHALVDSGNLSHSVISDKLFNRLHLELLPCQIKLISPNQTQIEVLGFSAPFSFYIENLKRIFTIQPIVVKNLTVPLNLSRCFLAQNSMSLSFSPSDSYLSCGDGRTPLHANHRSLMANSIDFRFKLAMIRIKRAREQLQGEGR